MLERIEGLPRGYLSLTLLKSSGTKEKSKGERR